MECNCAENWKINPLSGSLGASLMDMFLLGGIAVNGGNGLREGCWNEWSISYSGNKNGFGGCERTEKDFYEHGAILEEMLSRNKYNYNLNLKRGNPRSLVVKLNFEREFSMGDVLEFLDRAVATYDSASVFLTGALDGKMSLDSSNNGAVTMDIPESRFSDRIAGIVYKALDSLEIDYRKLNTSRERKTGGNRRNRQIRIKSGNSCKLFQAVGLTCPYRIRDIQHLLSRQKTGNQEPLVLKTSLFPNELPEIIGFSVLINEDIPETAKQDFIAFPASKRKIRGEFDGATREQRKRKVTTKSGRYLTNTSLAEKARSNGDYHCAICSGHETFKRMADGKPYVEVHHLIPMRAQESFDNSLDVLSNLICLCPNCHRKIHYGIDKRDMIIKLHKRRLTALQNDGLAITDELLLTLYDDRSR